MKLIVYLNVLLLLCLSSIGRAQDLPVEKRQAVENFVQLVKESNWEILAQKVNYPLGRNYPVPDIESPAEFIVRHAELFDDSLIALITHSITDSTTTWSESVGNNLSLNNGLISLDSRGYLSIINYESEETKALKEELIEIDRKSLPVALQEYERPVLQMRTEKFNIRIDETKGPSYRLVVWIIGNRNPNVPAVNIIPYGVRAIYTAKGVQTYTFESDFGRFVCFISDHKDDGSLPGDLLLYRDNKLVRSYPAITFQN